jgi:hypothetical protein
MIDGPGAASIAIDAKLATRVFTIGVTFPACPPPGSPPILDGPTDYMVSISGLRLVNARRNVADSSGGAIYSEHSLALDSVVIENSAARSGGAVANWFQYQGQSLTVRNSRFLDNTATELVQPLLAFGNVGGAIAVGEKCQNASDTPHTPLVSVLIAGSEFRGNSAQPLTDRNGRAGAFRSYSLADIYIVDSVFVDNHVDAPNPPVPGFNYHGGAIDGTAKSWRIERTEISENSANDVTGADVTRSGGLHLFNDSADRQDPSNRMAVKIINSTISGNLSSATSGAMVVHGNIALELINSTVSDNLAAPTRTGGIGVSRGNTSPSTGTLTLRPTVSLVSSILANNGGNNGDIAAGTGGFLPTFTVNATNSLVERFCPPPGCQMTFSGSGNLIGVDPQLAPLANNGGASRTHALPPTSPARGTGSNPLGLTTDQRGTGFPRAVGAVDMGAFEGP